MVMRTTGNERVDFRLFTIDVALVQKVGAFSHWYSFTSQIGPLSQLAFCDSTLILEAVHVASRPWRLGRSSGIETLSRARVTNCWEDRARRATS
jgi:hypothetical protein